MTWPNKPKTEILHMLLSTKASVEGHQRYVQSPIVFGRIADVNTDDFSKHRLIRNRDRHYSKKHTMSLGHLHSEKCQKEQSKKNSLMAQNDAAQMRVKRKHGEFVFLCTIDAEQLRPLDLEGPNCKKNHRQKSRHRKLDLTKFLSETKPAIEGLQNMDKEISAKQLQSCHIVR